MFKNLELHDFTCHFPPTNLNPNLFSGPETSPPRRLPQALDRFVAPARSFGGDFFGRQRQEVRGHSLCIMTSLANFDEANPRGMAADDGTMGMAVRNFHEVYGVIFFGIPLIMVSEKDAKGNVKHG